MKAKTKTILWYFGLTIIIGSIAFGVFHAGHPIAALVIIVIPVSMILNGFLAEWEDNQPGGFNDPTPKTPKNINE